MSVLKERGSQGGLIRARTQKENDTIYIQRNSHLERSFAKPAARSASPPCQLRESE